MTRRRIVHLIATCALAVSICFGHQPASLADMSVTQEVTTVIGTGGAGKSTLIQNLYWTKNKARAGIPSGGIAITDLDKKTFTIINTKQKTYIQESFEDLKKREANLPPQFSDIKLSVQETGEKKTIGGYPCEKLVFKVGPTEITVWVTKKITIDPAVTEFNKKFLELTKDVKTLNVEGKMRAEFEKHEAYPYLTIIEITLPFAGKTQRIESKVKKVSYEKINPSVFAVPADYKKATFPVMPPGK